jgi:hypothetical protein
MWPVLPKSQVDMVDEISLFGENLDWSMLDRRTIKLTVS